MSNKLPETQTQWKVRHRMVVYRVIDLDNMGFMDDTWDEPMTLNALRSRFWALDDVRTEKYKDFTSDFIQETWNVRFEEVIEDNGWQTTE